MGGAVAGIGEALSSSRERRGLSIDQVAQDTRISPRFLEALEAEQFQELPAPVYVRGFLRSYATYLGLEPQELLEELPGANGASPNGTNGRNGHAARGRTDPFRRGSVATASAVATKDAATPGVASHRATDDAWAPEPLPPIAPPHEDHGYIPGSDLMEAPEFAPEEEIVYAEPEPRFDRRTVGVLAERPPFDKPPGVPRKLALLGVGVAAVLAFLGAAVFLTRDDGDGGGHSAAASENEPAALGVGTIVSGDGGTATALATLSPTVSPAPGDVAFQAAATSPTGTVVPQPTTASGAAATATATAPAAAATPVPTSVPTAVPTAAPTATPTRVPTVVPANLGLGECQPNGTGSVDCGGGPYRVICYTPINPALNKNWWVDVNWDFGPLPAGQGWRETTVNGPSNGDIITAGADGCP